MCGICGIAFSDGRNVERDVLEEINNTLRHRGPDEAGYFFSEGIGLGIRRLKIIDLETGSQPIFNEDQQICVVYNGEIYNFIELRNDLLSRGHRFYTKSDTEVIVHLYEEFGIDMVKKLNGMFAFALWDNQKKILYLARDQFGIKPLYYALFPYGIIFASELKSILRYRELRSEIDYDSLCRYLVAEYIPSPHSIFKGIKKLPPGHYLKFDRISHEITRYWRLDLKDRYTDFDKAKEEFRELFKDAVRIRLVSDVPLGAFLSGGIDSSSVTYFMKDYHSSGLKTFSISFDDPSFDESKFSKKVAKILGTDHHDKRMTEEDLIDAIPVVFDFLDEPLGDASIVPTYLLSKFARESVTVVLSGDGGDELFAGYPTYIAHKLADGYSHLVPEFVHKNIFHKIAMALPVSFDNFSIDFKIKRFLDFAMQSPLERNIFWLGSFNGGELQELLAFPLQRTDFYEEQRSLFNIYRDLDNSAEQAQILDFFFYLQEDVLQKVDRASMACSLEVRIPFLDRRLVEFIWSLPFNFKLKNFKTKYILKKAMNGLLPSSILNRKKKGFGIPVAKWFAGRMKEVVLDIFNEERIKNDGIFNYKYVSRLLDEHFRKKVDHRKKLWTLFVFQNWLMKYGKS